MGFFFYCGRATCLIYETLYSICAYSFVSDLCAVSSDGKKGIKTKLDDGNLSWIIFYCGMDGIVLLANLQLIFKTAVLRK